LDRYRERNFNNNITLPAWAYVLTQIAFSDFRYTQNVIANHRNLSVELDALPVEVLQTRIVSEVEKHVDLDALAEQAG